MANRQGFFGRSINESHCKKGISNDGGIIMPILPLLHHIVRERSEFRNDG